MSISTFNNSISEKKGINQSINPSIHFILDSSRFISWSIFLIIVYYRCVRAKGGLKLLIYSRLPITRTFKGNRKKFKFKGNQSIKQSIHFILDSSRFISSLKSADVFPVKRRPEIRLRFAGQFISWSIILVRHRLLSSCQSEGGVKTLDIQSTPDNQNLQWKSKKVRVIGISTQITGSKEISKWMGRECN